jgi:hypothetical protein
MIENITEKLGRKFLFKISSKLGRNTTEEELAKFIEKLQPVETSRPRIRVGGNGDGGYLLPDDLSGIERCFSPGVAYTSSFELELASRGIPCSLADYSVDYSGEESTLIKFDKKFIGISNSKKFMTLASWVNRDTTSNTSDLLLQMDIEKYEYPVILGTSLDTLKRFRIMVIEFHSLDVLLKIKTFEYVKTIFEKILKDFYVVHIHPNNFGTPVQLGKILVPPVMEFTFYRKDVADVIGKAKNFPHQLDRKNVEHKEDLILPSAWYAAK